LNDPNPPILLLGNKRDLQDTRKVSEVEARALIDKWGGNCQWREVSAKLGQGINEAFLEITKQIQSKRQDTNEKSKEKKKKHNHHNRSSKLIKNCQIQ
jgi:GTPase SAR1 family protein